MTQNLPKSATNRRKVLRITTPKEWEAVISDVRFEMVCFLEGGGACSIAELALRMGFPADGLYHHMRVLQEAGVVREVGFRKVGRQVEVIYDLVADELTFATEMEGDVRQYYLKLIRQVMQCGQKAMQDALLSGSCRLGGKSSNASFRAETAWLTREEVVEVRGLLSSLVEIFQRSRHREISNGELHTLTYAFSPRIRRERAKKSAPSAKRRQRRADSDGAGSP